MALRAGKTCYNTNSLCKKSRGHYFLADFEIEFDGRQIATYAVQTNRRNKMINFFLVSAFRDT